VARRAAKTRLPARITFDKPVFVRQGMLEQA
jgi:hypothetical protein